MEKPILDVACGSKMFWFDKNNPHVEFCDNRTVSRHEYYPGRYIEISPDTVCDFTNLQFSDETFYLVVFDPPHLTRAGKRSWMRLKYGNLDGDWRNISGCPCLSCSVCIDYPIPADIAEKLGINPKEADHEKC